MDNLIGKVMSNEKDESYVILNQLTYKNILCVYARSEKDENIKDFFQISHERLVSIKSKKMLSELNDELFNNNLKEPRKINEDETISDYLAYLDEFYKGKVAPLI